MTQKVTSTDESTTTTDASDFASAEDGATGSASQDDGTESAEDDESATTLTQDALYDILADQRRRYTVHHLKQVDEPVSVQDLAEQVAAWENDKPIDALTSQERKRVYISLYQGHLSTLDDRGIVEYDEDAGVVEVTDAVRDTDVYLEVVEPRNIPWSQFYLGLSLASVAMIVLAWMEVGILEWVQPLTIAMVIAAAFAASAVFQLLQSGRIQLGDDGPPPELRET